MYGSRNIRRVAFVAEGSPVGELLARAADADSRPDSGTCFELPVRNGPQPNMWVLADAPYAPQASDSLICHSDHGGGRPRATLFGGCLLTGNLRSVTQVSEFAVEKTFFVRDGCGIYSLSPSGICLQKCADFGTHSLQA
jgi:hypothetical protein